MAVQKKFTRKELEQHNTRQDAIFIVDNIVYDVTKFLDEHPGGHEVLINVAGTDASENFDDVGHSLDAKELMKKYVVGELVDEDKTVLKKRTITWDEETTNNESSFLSSWKFPLVLGLAMTLLYTYLFA